jgi:hypothetical protein
MTPKQEEALRDWLQEAITPLIEQVLVKKLGQAMSYAATELVQPKREWVGLSDSNRDELGNEYMKSAQTADQFLRAIEAKLKEKNT